MTKSSNNIKKIYSVKSGSEAFIINKITLSNKNNLVIVVSDEAEIDSLYLQLQFFINTDDIELIKLPAWDIIPYDRLSPSIKIQSQRISGIYKIINSTKRKIIILSASGIVQKIIDPQIITQSQISIKKGDIIDYQDIIKQLIKYGYQRAEIAADSGEFAVRGNIIDIIDNISGTGVRLDFFGKELEIIRSYDPTTQLSTAQIDEFAFFPVSEIVLDETTRANFLEKYKSLSPSYFNDAIYQSIKDMRLFSGVENWLPLFYETLYPITDLFKHFDFVFYNQAHHAFDNFEQMVTENYTSRSSLVGKYGEDYFPINPRSLWCSKQEFDQLIEQNNKIELTSYDSPTEDNSNIKRVGSFIAQAKLNKTTAFQLLKKYRTESKKITIIGCNSIGTLERIKNNLFEVGLAYVEVNNFDTKIINTKSCIYLTIISLNTSFEADDYAFIGEQDLLGEKKQQQRKSTIDLEKIWDELSNFSSGDYVAHKTHGVGKYDRIMAINVAGNIHDCLKIFYEGNDILYLPVENIDTLTKYKASDESAKLDRLGNLSWQQRKAKVKNRIKEIAVELLKIAAIRKTRLAPIFIPEQMSYEAFSQSFPYIETDDQLAAIAMIEQDLCGGTPMDRLICGDVGFGKTEVAMRAAFIVATSAENPAQVAVIVPTTLLARQHFHNFKARFEKFSIRIEQVSRLVPAKEVKRIKEDLRDGKIDIIIGTHALLADDIRFKNLGLLIVDEEQHFGVKQKEKIKSLKSDCHVLTLTATPIPRTLQMSIVGIKDLSLIATPPINRLAIKTYVLPYDSHVIREAILREYNRGGSIFYVAPRIEHLDELLVTLKDLVPEVRVRIAHGQMAPGAIEEIMMDFYNRKFEVLLSTTIIESGIDLPFVNSIIIHRADMFGLSALYQLRGRVGRGKIRAFAYLTLPKRIISDEAKARLDVMQAIDNLGAGFSIASNDMDLRGFGNLLGEEQSGQVKEVGLELYQSMLSEAILNLTKKEIDGDLEEDFHPNINLGIPVLIPDNYIADISTKLAIYRRASKLESYDQIDEFSSELIDRFGKFPPEVSNFLLTLKIRSECRKLNIEKVDIGEKAILIGFKNNIFKNPDKLIDYISKNPGIVKLRPDQKIVLPRQFVKLEDRINYLSKFFVSLNELLD